jgi:hypothetical protein
VRLDYDPGTRRLILTRTARDRDRRTRATLILVGAWVLGAGAYPIFFVLTGRPGFGVGWASWYALVGLAGLLTLGRGVLESYEVGGEPPAISWRVRYPMLGLADEVRRDVPPLMRIEVPTLIHELWLTGAGKLKGGTPHWSRFPKAFWLKVDGADTTEKCEALALRMGAVLGYRRYRRRVTRSEIVEIQFGPDEFEGEPLPAEFSPEEILDAGKVERLADIPIDSALHGKRYRWLCSDWGTRVILERGSSIERLLLFVFVELGLLAVTGAAIYGICAGISGFYEERSILLIVMGLLTCLVTVVGAVHFWGMRREIRKCRFTFDGSARALWVEEVGRSKKIGFERIRSISIEPRAGVQGSEWEGRLWMIAERDRFLILEAHGATEEQVVQSLSPVAARISQWVQAPLTGIQRAVA